MQFCVISAWILRKMTVDLRLTGGSDLDLESYDSRIVFQKSIRFYLMRKDDLLHLNSCN